MSIAFEVSAAATLIASSAAGVTLFLLGLTGVTGWAGISAGAPNRTSTQGVGLRRNVPEADSCTAANDRIPDQERIRARPRPRLVSHALFSTEVLGSRIGPRTPEPPSHWTT